VGGTVGRDADAGGSGQDGGTARFDGSADATTAADGRASRDASSRDGGSVVDAGGEDGAVSRDAGRPVPDANLGCADRQLDSALGDAIGSGDTSGLVDRYTGSCSSPGVPEITYGWTAPSDGFYVFDTLGSSFDTALYARAAACDGPQLACNDDESVSLVAESLVSLRLRAGDPLVLFVDGSYTGADGSFVLNARRKCPGLDAGTGLGTLASESTSRWGDTFQASCGGRAAADRVVSWTAPSTALFTFDTFGSSYDTVLYARSAACEGAELACNDDDPVRLLSQSIINVPLTAGQRIFLFIDGPYSGADGSFELNARQKCPGTDLGTALGTPVVTGTTEQRGDSYAGSCGGSTQSEAVYEWTAPETGTFVFDTAGSTLDTVLYARQGCSGEELACNDDTTVGSGSSTLQLALDAGTTLTLFVDGSFSVGAFELNIRRL
jgi:hypothetical protein